MNENTYKKLLIVLMFVYIISPIDFFPGPIDDLIVSFIIMMFEKRLSMKDETYS